MNQSWNLTGKIGPNLYFSCHHQEISSDLIGLERLHFLMFFAKCLKCKIREKDGHGKSRNGHGKFMEKYFVKSVGTLIIVTWDNINRGHTV